MKNTFVILLIFVLSSCKQQFVYDCVTHPGRKFVYVKHFYFKTKKQAPIKNIRVILKGGSVYSFSACVKTEFLEDKYQTKMTLLDKNFNIIQEDSLKDFYNYADGLEFYNLKQDTFYLNIVPIEPNIRKIVCVVNYVGKR